MAGLSATMPWPVSTRAADPYNGPFYVSLAAIGGWDVTSFCDPKTNQPGERDINTWANSSDIQQIGNLRYAPVANNQAFFERFYQDMLVINGIDSQTNSHDDGVRHTWSGRLGNGYPSFGAIVSSAIGPQLPLSLVHDAGYSETAGIANFNRLLNAEVMRNVLNNSTVQLGETIFGLIDPDELNLITQAQNARLQRLLSNSQLLPRQRRNMNNLHLANVNREELKAFSNLLPGEFEADEHFRAAQLALLAYQSGLCVAAQLGIDGFDTHQDHDKDHFGHIAKLTSLVSYLFNAAEQAGFADRLVVTLASDFGRTPFYNPGGGKDHWPIGSAIIIKPGNTWGNRVVGATDETHSALNINAATLQIDNSNAGLRLQPKHLQQAVRQLAGIDQSSVAQQYPLFAEDVDFFNSAIQTTQ